MIYIKARIKLYNEPRTLPFRDGYHPLFNFVPDTKHGGAIHLLDREKFMPGDEGVVEVWFPVDEISGEGFGIGKRFTFDEGTPVPIGEGEIVEILEGETPPFRSPGIEKDAQQRYDGWLKDISE